MSDADAADVLAPLCEAIGEDLAHGLAACRYALSGDRRSLYGTILYSRSGCSDSLPGMFVAFPSRRLWRCATHGYNAVEVVKITGVRVDRRSLSDIHSL